MRKAVIFSVLCGILFFGCSAKDDYILFQGKKAQTQSTPKPTKKYIYEYKIVPGDRLSITMFNHPELSTNTSASNIQGIEVFPDGTIQLPLIGSVKIAGLTTEAATKKIQKLYAEYIRHPYVKLDVLTKRVYVLGEVKQPGVVQISGDYTNLIYAISQRGGFTDMARKKTIKIISGNLNNPTIKTVDLTNINSLTLSKIILKPNDIVYVEPYGTKPLDVQIQGVSPIVNFLNSIMSTFVNVKVLSE